MAEPKGKPEQGFKINSLGIFLALGFYLISVIVVTYNNAGGTLLGRDVKTLTIAHWQLEDGFRQGFDEAIRQFEAIKAKEGVKVKIIQSTVPVRGYQQWFVTQLISGDPADIIELQGASQLHNQYFVSLSNYIAAPNPYNRGTPLEGIPWKDTYVDGMNGALDGTYADYFGVGTFFHVMRVYVNKKLLREATGDTRIPATFDEWMECCRKLRAYGVRIGKPIIPIGVRGLDKGTVNHLFQQNFSQLNGNINDTVSEFGGAAPGGYELFAELAAGKLDRARLLQAVELTREMGQYFSEGFTATDLEQTKFLFFTGNIGFFPEGSWDAWSIVKNSPFEVEVINLPVIGSDNRFRDSITGRPTEIGVGVGGKFGITKESKHFDLALEFLQFLTSYKVNQLTMMEYSKWPPAVIRAEYKGLLEKFRPVVGDARLNVQLPFTLDKKSQTKMLESLERIIIGNSREPQQQFWRDFIDNLPNLIEEAWDTAENGERQLFDIEAQRSGIALGLLSSPPKSGQHRNLETRELMALENIVERERLRYQVAKGLSGLRHLEKEAAAKKGGK